MILLESSFSKYITAKLEAEGAHTMRIETGTTVVGCPDLWVQGNGDDFFIELKKSEVTLAQIKERGIIKVPWRNGQVAWARLYLNSHVSSPFDPRSGARALYKVSWTFVRVKDGVVAIRMNDSPQHYHDNVAAINEDVFLFTMLEFGRLGLFKFLQEHTYSFLIKPRNGDTWKHFLTSIAHEYLTLFARSESEQVDFPVCSDWMDEVLAEVGIKISADEEPDWIDIRSRRRAIDRAVRTLVWEVYTSYEDNKNS